MRILIILFLLIPFHLNATVFSIEQWTDFYLRDCTTLEKNRACKQDLELILGRMVGYSKMMFKYLDKEDLPRWLIAVPAVESSFKPDAISRSNAIGLWQLMPFNIRHYMTKEKTIMGQTFTMVPTPAKILKYGKDPVINTRLGAKHMGILFKQFRYHKETAKLSILAYNCGASRVKSWLLGKSTLPSETQNYYNKIMAVKHIIRNMKALGVKPVRQLTIIERLKGWM
jgi:hypothetical protein